MCSGHTEEQRFPWHFQKMWQFTLKMAAITFAVTTGKLQSSVQINAESQSKMALPTMLLWELQLVWQNASHTFTFIQIMHTRQTKWPSVLQTHCNQAEGNVSIFTIKFGHSECGPLCVFVGHHFTHEFFEFPTILYTFHKQINGEVWFLEKDRLITKYKYIK